MNTTNRLDLIKPLISLLLSLCFGLRYAYSLPVQQILSRSSSSIRFGVDSNAPALQMMGTFKEFKGTLTLDLEQLERSLVNVTLNLQSAQLSPDQILQAVFLQTALAHVNPPSTTFKSTSITRGKGETYLITGTYTWMGRSRNVTVPVRIINVSPLKTEIRVLLNGVLEKRHAPPELVAIAPDSANSKGWAKATLVFLREPERR